MNNYAVTDSDSDSDDDKKKTKSKKDKKEKKDKKDKNKNCRRLIIAGMHRVAIRVSLSSVGMCGDLIV